MAAVAILLSLTWVLSAAEAATPDGRINAFDPVTGVLQGTLLGADGNPLFIDGLWGLIQGNDGAGGDSNKIYFTAGPNGETNGLFGSLSPAPLPGTLLLLGSGLLSILASCQWSNQRD